MRRRVFLAVLAAFVLSGVGAAPALANHHLMKIREVYPGTALNPDSAYIELQMYSTGENFVNGQSIRTYNASGTEIHSFMMNANVPNGQTQRTVLIADEFPPNAVTEDFTDTALGTNIVPAGGAVCFTSAVFGPIDCVSWGNFSGSLPSAAGDPALTVGGIPDGDGLRRSISPGCGTLLENSDDTNDSAVDFNSLDAGDLDPRPNSQAPTEHACPGPPNTKLTSKPPAKTKDRTPSFKFKATPSAGASFKCKIDGAAYKSCSSPFTARRLSFGKHSFKVRAKNANGTDASAAGASFKVIKKHKKHR